MRARLAANTPWTSMAVHSCSVCLGDDERILHDTASYERVCHHSRIAVTPSFPSSPAVQGLAGFLDVSNVPGIIAPRLFRLYITRRFFLIRLQRHHSCYECLYHFRKRSSGTKSISFRCSQLDHVFQPFWNRYLLSWLERQWCLKGLRSCLDILSQVQKLAKYLTSG
ncbi:hypothetical protein BD769DRAFT_558996 [Suillus cothurnatus]|nr:hypothetical protein BD769DRAFT_558996 [Suillus cothurnatus]